MYYKFHGVLSTYLFLYIWIDNIASYQGAYYFLVIALRAPNVYVKNFLSICSCLILDKDEKKVCSIPRNTGTDSVSFPYPHPGTGSGTLRERGQFQNEYGNGTGHFGFHQFSTGTERRRIFFQNGCAETEFSSDLLLKLSTGTVFSTEAVRNKQKQYVIMLQTILLGNVKKRKMVNLCLTHTFANLPCRQSVSYIN